MNKAVAIGLAVSSAFLWFGEPGSGGMLFESVDVTPGEARIMSTIAFVGAAIIWFMPGKE